MIFPPWQTSQKDTPLRRVSDIITDSVIRLQDDEESLGKTNTHLEKRLAIGSISLLMSELIVNEGKSRCGEGL